MKIATKTHPPLIESKVNNYKMIDIMKYIATIMVICIHCDILFPQEYFNFFIKNIVCRIAVPFFFMSSAYFVRKRSACQKHYINIYLKRLIKSYCLWSLVFIPIGLDWIHQNLSLANYLLPFTFIFGFIHVGIYYHLWYVPAMIFALILVDKLLKNFSYTTLFIISIVLFMFGSVESYYGLLQNGWFKDFFDLFIKVFFTTRSGLLYGMIFTLIGFYIYDYQKQLFSILKYIPILTILFFVLLILEGTFLYHINRLDMNFLFMLIPLSFCLFLWIFKCPYGPPFETDQIRQLSKYYYFIHPVCIVIVEEITRGLGINILSIGLVSFALVILLTHFLSTITIKVKWPLKKLYIAFSFLMGMIITITLAGAFFQLKLNDVIVKFELVSCLWFYISFVVYYLLSRESDE